MHGVTTKFFQSFSVSTPVFYSRFYAGYPLVINSKL